MKIISNINRVLALKFYYIFCENFEVSEIIYLKFNVFLYTRGLML